MKLTNAETQANARNMNQIGRTIMSIADNINSTLTEVDARLAPVKTNNRVALEKLVGDLVKQAEWFTKLGTEQAALSGPTVPGAAPGFVPRSMWNMPASAVRAPGFVPRR